MIKNFILFLKVDIWRIRTKKLSSVKSFWIRQLRVFLLSIRGFDEDKCQLRASALTFFSLLSIVPVIAMAFGIAKGFGFEKMLEAQIFKQLNGQKEVAEKIIFFAQSFLENTKGGIIAGIGVVLLFWTIIKLLGNIEDSFNDIWGVKRARTLGRKFSDYLSIMFICPILLIMASSLTVFISSQIVLLAEKWSFLGPLSYVLIYSTKIFPYAVIWIVFTFIYIFMPNTKVNFRAAFLGALISGTAYQLVQWIYITFQVGAVKFGAIYGSFAALPLFLVWLQMSWLVLLFGAEISFAEQNVETYEFEPDCLKVSNIFKKLVALAITHTYVINFNNKIKPLTNEDISHKLELPVRLVNQVTYELTEAGVLSEVRINKERATAFQPAFDISNFSIGDLLNMLDMKGVNDIPLSDSIEKDKMLNYLNGLMDYQDKTKYNILIKDI